MVPEEENFLQKTLEKIKSLDSSSLISKYRYPLIILLSGFIILGLGIFLVKSEIFSETKVEVLSDNIQKDSERSQDNFIFVEVAGAVENPGVYRLPKDSRINDLLVESGGLSAAADRNWVEKNINKAGKLSDGQKVYILSLDNQSEVLSARNKVGDQNVSSSFSSQGNGLININTASLKVLDSLPGIGQVYAQSIIDHRPYSNVEELLSKDALKKSVYEKIKDKITAY